MPYTRVQLSKFVDPQGIHTGQELKRTNILVRIKVLFTACIPVIMVEGTLYFINGIAEVERQVSNSETTLTSENDHNLVCDLASHSSPSARYFFGFTPLISARSSFGMVDMFLWK